MNNFDSSAINDEPSIFELIRQYISGAESAMQEHERGKLRAEGGRIALTQLLAQLEQEEVKPEQEEAELEE